MGSIEIFKLFGSIFVDNDEANRSIHGTGKEAEGLTKKLGRGIKTAGKWALGITTAAVGIGAAAFAMTKKVTNSFDDIAKSSTKLGITTDAYQEMDYWASQNGLSHEGMEKAVGRFNQRLGQAEDGNDKYASALDRLGVNLDDVRNGTLSTEDAFTQSIQKLSEMDSETEKVALATEMFGTRMARDLMPALQDGSLSIEDAKEKAQELGIVIEEDTLNAAEEFNDTWDDLTRTMGAFGQKILAQLMPIFQSMMDWVMDHMPQIQAVFQTVFDVIGTIFGTAIELVQTLIGWFSQWFETNQETMNGIWTTIQEVFTNIIEFLQEAWQFIIEFWNEHGQSLLDNAKTIFESIWSTVETIFNAVKDIIVQIIGFVVPWVQEKLQVLQKFWEENGDKIMKAVQNVFSFIQGVIEFVMPIITGIIKGAWDIITAVFDTAIGVIMGLVDFFASMFTGDFKGMKKAVIDIFKSIWDGIKGIVQGAWNLLSGAFKGLWSSVSGWFTGLKDDAVNWGKNMIQGFIDGIKNMAGKVKDAAKGVMDSVKGFLKFWSPAKEGEGRFITDWGENMVDGFLDGVRNETSEAGEVMNDLVESMSPKTLDFNARVGARGSNITSGQATQTLGGNSIVETLLIKLIHAVESNKDVYIDGVKVTGVVNDNNAVDSMIGGYMD